MGRHQLKPSLKWMGAFWLSIAGNVQCSSHCAVSACRIIRLAGQSVQVHAYETPHMHHQ